MKNVLVIGIGSLGGTIVDRLTEKGISCTLVTRSGEISNDYWKKKLSSMKVIQADLLSDTSNLEKLKGIDTIFYTAAPEYWLWNEELVRMVQAGLEVAEKLNAVFVYADNLYAYGASVSTLTETTELAAKSQKGIARKLALKLVQDSHKSGTVKTVTVQSSDFYGPSVDISMLGKDLFVNALTNKPVYLLGKTHKQHSFTYIVDFAEAMIQLASAVDGYGQVWIAPTAEPISVNTFLDKLSKAIAKPITKKVAPKLIFYILGFKNKPIKEIREIYYLYDQDFLVSSEKFSTQFQILPTSIDQGIESTIASYHQ